MKNKNIKDTTKCAQYNVIMTVIDGFQQLNLFVFELFFYVIGNMSIKLIIKFVIFLASLKKKSSNYLKKYYIFIKFCPFNRGKWGFFSGEFFFFLVWLLLLWGLGPALYIYIYIYI